MAILKHSEGSDHIRKSFKSFPEQLEGRMLSIMPCVNSEWKSLTLGNILSSTQGKSGYQLEKEFALLTDRRLCPTETTFDGYCHKTFHPLGLVSIERINGTKRFPNRVFERFSLTEAGEKYGAPIAAFTAEWASRNRQSHYPYLGSTQSTGDTRSPFNRAWMLMSISAEAHRFTRNIDFVRDMFVSERRITTHLRELKKAGLINYSSIDPEQEWIRYHWKDGADPEEAKSNPKIARTTQTTKHKIIDLLFSKNELMTPSEIGRILGYTRRIVSEIMIPLREAGYLTGNWTAAVKHSNAKTTQEGDDYVNTYLRHVVDALMDKPVLGEMSTLRSSLTDFSFAAAKAYQPFSHAAKSKSNYDRILQVLTFVREFTKENGRGPRVREIFEATETKCNQYIRTARRLHLLDIQTVGIIRFNVLTDSGIQVLDNPDALHELL